MSWNYDNQGGLSQKADLIILSNQRWRKQPRNHAQSSVQYDMGEGSNPALTGMTSEVSNSNLTRFVKRRLEKISYLENIFINICLISAHFIFLGRQIKEQFHKTRLSFNGGGYKFKYHHF